MLASGRMNKLTPVTLEGRLIVPITITTPRI